MLVVIPTLTDSQQPALAESNPVITVESKEIHRGQTFDLAVNLDSNPTGILSMQLYVEYNHNVMTLVGARKGTALSTLNMTVHNPGAEGQGYSALDFNVLWDGRGADYSTGNILVLTFESKIDAPEGVYEVSLSYAVNQTATMVDEREQFIDLTINKGYVTFKKGAYVLYYVDYDWDQTEEGVLYKYESNQEGTDTEQARKFPVNDPSVTKPSRPADLMYSYTWDTQNPWEGMAYTDPNNNAIIVYKARYVTTPQIKQIIYKVAESDDYGATHYDANYWEALGVSFSYGDQFAYGELVTLENPKRTDYTFYGWYEDENHSTKFSNTTMPAVDGQLTLYGYFKYNIREDNVPTILLSYEGKNDSSQLVVDLELLDNASTGLSAMVLSVEWQEGIKLVGYQDLTSQNFESLIITDFTGGDYVQGYRFYFDAGNQQQNNTYEEGKFLRLFFDRQSVDTLPGAYWVNVSNVQASYFDELSRLWYTHINFKPDGQELNVDGLDEEHYFTVPLGTISFWEQDVKDDGKVTVQSNKELDSNVQLNVDSKSTNVTADRLIRQHLNNDDVSATSSYDIFLAQNQIRLNVKQLGALLEITIKLTEWEQQSHYLGLFYINGDTVTEFVNDASKHESGYWHLSEDGEYLIFYTDHLSEWSVVSDKTTFTGKANVSLVKIILLILPSIALAMVVFGNSIKYRKNLKMKNSGGIQ